MNKKGNKNKENTNTIISGLACVFGTFCLALCYNLFLLPNNIVVGGTSGLAIVINELTGFSVQAFIYLSSIILLISSRLFLGKEAMKRVIIGSLLYPLFVTFTYPIAIFLLKFLSFQEILVTVALASLLHGLGDGIIYKYGFSTGGSDVVVKIISKYCHVSEGKSSIIFNIFIIIAGAFTFGIDTATYAVIILVINSIILDKISIGISVSKKFMIYTHKTKKIKSIIEDEFLAGYTIFPTIGGYSHTHGSMIMCVIRNKDVLHFKTRILEEDPEVFFVISDCYEVQGGIRRSNLPFV